jgi:transcriptional repressor NrdR
VKCPYCGDLEDKVIDSRLSQEGAAIRRRRECEACSRRFTTYERIEEAMPLVVKKDGTREPFDRQKVMRGLQRAAIKRPIDSDDIERIVSDVERVLQESGEREVPSTSIGQAVLERLQPLDDVAYVRFASVYRDFGSIEEFLAELSGLQAKKK